VRAVGARQSRSRARNAKRESTATRKCTHAGRKATPSISHRAVGWQGKERTPLRSEPSQGRAEGCLGEGQSPSPRNPSGCRPRVVLLAWQHRMRAPGTAPGDERAVPAFEAMTRRMSADPFVCEACQGHGRTLFDGYCQFDTRTGASIGAWPRPASSLGPPRDGPLGY